MSVRSRTRRLVLPVAGLSLVVITATGCGGTAEGSGSHGAPAPARSTDAGPGAADGVADTSDHVAPRRPHVRLSVPRRSAPAPVSTLVGATTDLGHLTRVHVTSPAGTVSGALSADGRTWTAVEGLDPATAYVVTAIADHDGVTGRRTARFTTDALSLDEQTYPTVLPAAESTVGIGMPVVARFDVPVTDRAAFERHMHVTSTPAQRGSWHWMSDTEARWRPAHYWSPGTEVDVDLDLNGVAAGGGVYGQESRHQSFTVGAAHVLKVSAVTDQMRVFSGGRLVRTIPITTGKPGYTTRSGVKVIVEKFTDLRMNSETVGIGGSEAYDLDDVKWDLRLTYSGEFIHAAPWSVASQGQANVSHGCTGMSTEDAAWLYDFAQVGDVVVTTGTDKPMTLDNGFGDWNEPFSTYRRGSAL